MYLRFVSPLRSCVRGVNMGIFQSAFECRDEPLHPEFLRNAIRIEIDWFKKHLPSPDEKVFQVKSRGYMQSVGICWFKSEASEMISRAFSLRALLSECGMQVTTIGTAMPGQILYADDYQIVAKPATTTPTKWG